MAEELNNDLTKTTKKIGEESLKYMKKQYMENNMSSHIGNLNLHAIDKRYKNGFVLSSGNDEIAVYNEFGIGIIGAENKNPLASDVGYEYNVESPFKGEIPLGAIKQWGEEYCKMVTTEDTWWYFKEGKWWHSRGYKGKQMYYGLVEILNETAIRDLKASVSQTIGNYNSRR